MNAVTAPLNPCNGPPPENVEPAEAAADATLAEVRVEPAALPELPRASAASTVLATLAVVAALGWGQRFLVPVTAGLMLAMLVMPVNAWLSHALRSRALATVTTLLLVMGALAAGATAFGGQLLRVAERAPEMISMVAQQLALRDPGTDSVLMRARDALHELDRAADTFTSGKPLTRVNSHRKPAAAAEVASQPVAGATFIQGATVALRETAVTGSGALIKFAGDMTIIFFIAFFVLAGGKPLNDRVIDLWGHHAASRQRAQSALLECAHQIRIYAGVLLVSNTLVGVAVWVAFAVSGLPDAAGWGVTAAVLHVVPYLGMALLTGLGAAESFLVHGTLASALSMAAFLVLLSTIAGTLVTAWLQGRAAKMNSAAVFIGLVFWGALWGVWGLFLGPALVVLLKVIAEHSRSGQRLARLMQG